MIKLFEEKQKKFFEDTLQNRCSWKFSNIHRKNICVESFFNKRLQHRYFPENFAKCLRTPFLQNSSGPFIKTTENYLENLFSKNGGSWKQEMCKYNDKRKKKLMSSVITIWQEPKQENVKKILKKTLLLLRFFEVQIRSNWITTPYQCTNYYAVPIELLRHTNVSWWKTTKCYNTYWFKWHY